MAIFHSTQHQIIIITAHIPTVIKGHNFETPGAISKFSEKKNRSNRPTTYDCQ